MPRRPRIHGQTCGGKRHGYESHRLSAFKRGYTKRWQRASKAYRRAHPLCVKCLKNGRVELATEVDHIKPHRGDDTLLWDEANWQALCKRCHSRKTRRERNVGV